MDGIQSNEQYIHLVNTFINKVFEFIILLNN